ncbi:MAG TPA: hypothetical protein VJ036_04645 [bacterium]|nr:hypothetical protein [bacterium]
MLSTAKHLTGVEAKGPKIPRYARDDKEEGWGWQENRLGATSKKVGRGRQGRRQVAGDEKAGLGCHG